MSVRRIAVLVGSRDPTSFRRHERPDRPGEAAVLAALRAQRSASEANLVVSANSTRVDGRRRIARHAGARTGARWRRAREGDPGGPSRSRALATARPQTVRHASAPSLARPLADA
jgi:hypothetical protein